ncbi:MAG: hypothetical protein Q4F44_07320 [Bacteroidales bacterium]|nr:hypothetical protein [Bacteroidales bacterium]
MKEGLGIKLICEAAEVFMYSDEELRRELPAQEAEELIELRNSLLTGPEPVKSISLFNQDNNNTQLLAAEEPEPFNTPQ